jgi:TRAP-type uncharacterized transport system fused permease subunit
LFSRTIGFNIYSGDALMGTTRGGPAKVAVPASGFFGSLSGSLIGCLIVGAVVALGKFARAVEPIPTSA